MKITFAKQNPVRVSAFDMKFGVLYSDVAKGGALYVRAKVNNAESFIVRLNDGAYWLPEWLTNSSFVKHIGPVTLENDD